MNDIAVYLLYENERVVGVTAKEKTVFAFYQGEPTRRVEQWTADVLMDGESRPNVTWGKLAT